MSRVVSAIAITRGPAEAYVSSRRVSITAEFICRRSGT